MTHQEAISTNPALEPTACAGELERTAGYEDRAQEGGQTVTRTIEVFECRGCGWRIPIADGKALNHYPVRAMVALLAAQFNGSGPARRSD